MIGGIASFFGIDNARVGQENLRPVGETAPVAPRPASVPSNLSNDTVNITLSANARAYLAQLSPDQAYVATTRAAVAKGTPAPVNAQKVLNEAPNSQPSVQVKLPDQVQAERAGPAETAASVEGPDDLVSDVVQTIRDVLTYAREGAGIAPADIAILEDAAGQFDERLSNILQNASGDQLTDVQAEAVIDLENSFFERFDAIFGLDLSDEDQAEVQRAEAAYQVIFDDVYGPDGNLVPSREDLNRLQEAEQVLQSQLDQVFGPELLPEQEQRLGTALENFNTVREQYFAGINPDDMPEGIRARLETAEDVYLQTLNSVFAGKATYTRQHDRQIQQAQAFFTDSVQRAARDFYQLGQST